MATHAMETTGTGTGYAGPTEEVSAQLRDLERQGGGMARLAHFCAALLLMAFSLGSLVSISATPFFRFLHHANLPDAISIAVNVLLVIAADVALLYAASVLRVLVTAQAPRSEQRYHRVAMIGAALLESATYLYLVWSFDRPTTAFLWAIGITRAVGAPLFAAYLSMARPLPVGPRDVAYQAALAAGKGVVRDVTTLAGDPSAPLARKVRIYNAAALMSPQDRVRFAGIIEAVSEESQPESRPVSPPPPHGGLPAEPSAREGGNDAAEGSRYVAPLRVVSGARASMHATRGRLSRNEQLRTQAFALLDKQPDLPKTELRKALRTRQETANALHSQWQHSQRTHHMRRA